MIAVIADDFTGAAELAGIALRYNLKIQLAMPGVAYNGAELFIVCTDSRSMNKEQAVAIHSKIVSDVIKLKPEFIFKKIDSVLRGHVLDELKIQMSVTGKSKAIIVAANPSLGRTIKNGIYYIDGKEIHTTSFAIDPEFAITDSSVSKMLRGNDERIVIAEASTKEDVGNWAGKISNDWVIAGAGDFFTALLDKRFSVTSSHEAVMQLPHLYVCGTSFANSRNFIKHANEYVVYLPSANDDSFLNEVHNIIAKQQKCIIAVHENTTGISALALRTQMARLTKIILEKENISEMFIEGGSTAAAILEQLNINSLIPENQLMRGVTRMKAGHLHITVKPGSYALPPQIISIYNP